MANSRASRHGMKMALAALAAVVVMVSIGGVAMASNAGFKINMPFVPGENYVSLPYFNPYATAQDLCDALGLVNAPAGNAASIRRFVSPCDTADTAVCGTPAAATYSMATTGVACPDCVGQACPTDVRGQLFDLILPAGNPASGIIVGSHDPTLQLTLPSVESSIRQPPIGPGGVGVAAAGGVQRLFFSVPYHTTAVNIADLCTQLGLTLAPLSEAASVTVFQPAPQTITCGTPAAAGRALILGEGLRVNNNGCDPVTPSQCDGPITFTPAHF